MVLRSIIFCLGVSLFTSCSGGFGIKTKESDPSSHDIDTNISPDVTEIHQLTEVDELDLEGVSEMQSFEEELYAMELQANAELLQKVEEANAPFKDPTNLSYVKFAKHLPEFDQKIHTCLDRYDEIFSAHIKDDERCVKLRDSMSDHKTRMVKRCMNLEYNDIMAEETRDRLVVTLPRSIERINRQYRQAAVMGCVLGEIPDQSDINHVFNGSAEIAKIDGNWDVVEGAAIPGWKVRFYDAELGVVEKKGLLEIQSNALYRKEVTDETNRSYMELDSGCAAGYNCPTTNVSIKQKIIVETDQQLKISFDARMRRNIAGDSVIEVHFYKKGERSSDDTLIDHFEVSDGDGYVPVGDDRTMPVSTNWELYWADLGVLEDGEYFLEINEVGTPNTYGTLIDKISIHR